MSGLQRLLQTQRYGMPAVASVTMTKSRVRVVAVHGPASVLEFIDTSQHVWVGWMEQDWAERVRKYRRRAGLTQEQLADLFLVEPRTIRRWEAGQTRPPLEVRLKLHRNAVPVVQRPEVAALTSLVTSSGEGMMLLDERLTVLAASARDRAWFQSQFGREPVGLSLEPFLPVAIRDLLGQYGGWEKAVQAGLSSFATDFAVQRREIGNTSDFVGRMQHTILRMGDGVRLHLSRSRTLEPTQALIAPELTFVDEITAEG